MFADTPKNLALGGATWSTDALAGNARNVSKRGILAQSSVFVTQAHLY